eukprot:CAMPEP_0117427976 /NCGR_PEP_ID=MMETSP0758-20121206/7762_1 /TAXON_ID=63605 /ORGANISM="Percolomonas cosmopolitus, Strain AE-1 (ATCC 50343)" /LENGTH=312 /DNA_ID=CAMNT_0005214027 /DNA_START=29 /DNA_END=964 /DNA_ORIENTATION=+
MRLAIVLAAILGIIGCMIVPHVKSTLVEEFGVDHHIWGDLLQKYVKKNQTLEGISLSTVDYEGMKEDERFEKYIKSFELINFSKFDGEKDRETLIALFANMYNALAMKMTIEYPCKRDVFGYCDQRIGSIVDSGGNGLPLSEKFVDTVWKRRVFNIGGEEWSLDDVENYLRGHPRSELPSNAPQQLYKPDFRLHANIVCASISCPDIYNQAFFPELLDMQLTLNINSFLGNKEKGLNVISNNLHMSKIFFWFEQDFVKAVANSNNTYEKTNFAPIGFLLNYLYPDSFAYKTLSSNHFKTIKKEEIQFFDYNW